MKFFKIIHFFEKVSRFCFQQAFPPQTSSLSQVMQENVIMPKCGVSRFHFQRALNHPQSLSLSQVMQENILSKKLSLGLNFSTPSGGDTSPSLKGSMVDTETEREREREGERDSERVCPEIAKKCVLVCRECVCRDRESERALKRRDR